MIRGPRTHLLHKIEFNPQNPTERKEATPESCLLTISYAPALTHVTHTK